MQAIGVALLIFGLIMLSSYSVASSLISYVPGTSSIEHVVDMNSLISTAALSVIALGLIVVGLGAVGYCGACCKISILLYLVSHLYHMLPL